MIGATELALMKPTAYLVNTARGNAVDEQALIQALRSGRLAGAALDVFEKEPLPPDSALRELDNVILTSHIVGHVSEMHDSFLHSAIENVTRVLRGETPLYVRNPEVIPAWRGRLQRMSESLLQVS
jgi:D-3-phosphoglycerate dehydrogenase